MAIFFADLSSFPLRPSFWQACPNSKCPTRPEGTKWRCIKSILNSLINSKSPRGLGTTHNPTYPKVSGFTISTTTVIKDGEEHKIEMVEHPVFNYVENICGELPQNPFKIGLLSSHLFHAGIFAPILGCPSKRSICTGISECHRPAGHCSIRL